MTKKLMLDAGHGKNTAGKRTPNGANGVVHEWTMNNAVCNMIAENLKDYKVEIKRSDDTTGNTDVALATRVSRCNSFAPDFFVSIHQNANSGTWNSATGTEVYHHTSGTGEDKKVAALVAPILASKVGLTNRGVKHAAFAVLTCKATAILCEGGFMDSTKDYPIITSAAGQRKYAAALTEAIVSYLKLEKKANTGSGTSTNTSTYTVVKNDTLWSISQKFGVSVAKIKELNNLKTDTINPGQKLVLNAATYTVVKNDTLWSISQKFGVSVAKIKELNNLKTDTINPGQILKIK